MPHEPAKTEVDAGTFQPDVPPSTHPADPETFRPLDLPDRELRVNRLPTTAADLFKAFLPVWLIAKWAENSGSSVAEIYCFLACLIYMGLHPENSIRAYWTKDSDLRPKHTIQLFMCRNRFEELYKYFTFWDPEEEGDPGLHRVFARLTEVSEVVKNASKRLIQLPLHITIDEAMIAFTGRSIITTFVQGKPDPLGFKVWAIGMRGYIIDWLWHENHRGPVGLPALPARLGKNSPDSLKQLKALNPTQRVVVELLRRLPQQPYHVYMDNLFASIGLLTYLRDYMGIGCTATCRERSGVFKGFVEAKKKDANKDLLPWNSLAREATEDGKIQQFRYKGNTLCLAMSTVYSGNEDVIERPRKRPKTKSGKAFFKDAGSLLVGVPAIMADYNLSKDGIDVANQLRSYNSWNHRIRRGREKCIFLRFILEIALVNSFLLQQWAIKDELAWDAYTSQSDWRRAILEGLFARYGYQSRAGERGFSSANSFENEPSSHTLVNRHKKSDCKACRGFSINSQKRTILGEVDGNIIGKRSQTVYGCKECDVALCNNDSCSDNWHKQIC